MKTIMTIIQIYIYSFIATALFFPVSALDTYYIATFNLKILWYIFPIIIISEIINAIIVYKFSKLLSDKIIRKESHKLKLEKIQTKIEKYGFWGIALAGATPLPYSLVLYSLGATKWGNIKKVTLAVLIGRSIKYIALAIVAYFGFSILNIWQTLTNIIKIVYDWL